MKKKSRYPISLVCLLLILALAAALRLQHIRADPPPLLVALTRSAGIFFDEAMYCHNARNKILFNKWTTDDWNPLLYNAVLTGVYYAGFKLFGLSIVTVKATSIAFGLLGILFLYLAVRRILSEYAALGITLLFAVDYYWTMYNRIGLLENFSTLFFILSTYFLVKSREKPWPMAFVGVCVAMTVLSKYLFFYFFLTASLAILYAAQRQKRWRPALLYLFGLVSVLIVWLFAIYLPLSSSFRKIGSGWMDLSWPESVGIFFFNIYRNNLPRYMSLVPLLFIVGLLFTAMVIVRLVKKNPPPDILEVFVLLWIFGTFFQMAILNYQPMRYYLTMVPALFFALSLAINKLAWLREHARQVTWVLLPLAGLFWRFWVGLVKPPSAFFSFYSLPFRILLYFSLAVVVFVWLRASRRFFSTAFVIIICFLALSYLHAYYAHFFKHPTFQLQGMSRWLQSLPADTVLMGNEAPRLALETKFRFFVAFEGWFNDKDPFRLHRPTHLLVLNKFWGGELVWIKRRFPDIAANLKFIRNFPIWDTSVGLYKVDYPPGY